MRKMILMLALAGVATPALADPQDGWEARRAARAEQRQDRAAEPQRAEQPREGRGEGRWQQRPEAAQAPQAPQPERGMRGGWNRGDDAARQAQGIDPAQVARWRERQEQDRARQAGDGAVPASRWSDRARQQPVGGWNQQVQGQVAPVARYGTRDGGQRQWNGQRWNGQRWDGNRSAGQWQGGQWQGGQWQGQQQARRWDGNRDGQRWSNDWRRDSRYDWQRYRSQNRSIFRVGRYDDPFGWGYRPLSVGFTLYAGYYQPNYWLDDPWQYRLPPVYGPYRWVRYYDDAVLVDIYSGEVVDVIQGFFW